ncbi:SPRY-domain-containing protein [Ramaria rubella]|nr:SPRY-domain-containing protein [Ramaria rubella]
MSSSPTTRRSASSSFVPRVVRGTIPGRDASGSSSNSTGFNSRPPVSPTRTRRPSNSATASLSSTHRLASTPSSTSTLVPPPSHAASFPRPAYLEHSALRYCIQSNDSGTPPDMYRFDSLHISAAPTKPQRARDVVSPSRDTDSDEDSNTSIGDQDRVVPPPHRATRKAANTLMPLPTRWSDGDRCPSLSVSVDGRDLTFHGPTTGGEKDAAAARSNFPIPAACGVYYYEIDVVNKGQKGHPHGALRFGTDTVRLSRLPGWEGQSWGYHGDDGNSFASERDGSSYGPKFTTGDVVGCGIDFSSGQAFFTKNGRYLGPVFENLGSVEDLYPTVGLRTPGEAIRANFGHESFMFDIDTHVEQLRNRTWARIQTTPVTWSMRGSTGTFVVSTEVGKEVSSNGAALSHVGDESAELAKPVNELILAYLAHHGYAKSARAFKSQCDRRSGNLSARSGPSALDSTTAMDTDGDGSTPIAASSSSTVRIDSGLGDGTAIMQNDTLQRQKIVRSIVNGDIDTALDETKVCYPKVLEREGGLILFKLRCRKFVELVLDAAAAWRKVREEEESGNGKDPISVGIPISDGEAMDVDDDGSINGATLNGNTSTTLPSPTSKFKTKQSSSTVFSLKTPSQLALERALANGQSLQADYKADTRPQVQAIYKRTLSLVAYDDPLADDPRVPEAVKEMAGQAARDQLAEEVNRAILESQGRPPHPALERLYRQTQACIMQLGWLGVGAAAFADMPKEFLDA